MNQLPIGQPVAIPQHLAYPERKSYTGRCLSLRPIQPETDAPILFNLSHNHPQTERLWAYMAYGPFADARAMAAWMQGLTASQDPLFLTAHHHGLGPVGMVSFMNVVPSMLRLELGNIWYVPSVWRTPVNTEATYLMLCAAFDGLGYRRVEWKCDALNQASRNAALRLGFSFEGIFQQHMIIKGRNRDTAWFAMMDHQWPAHKARLEQWLTANLERS